MKKLKAVYAANLDPITHGHINVIERMAPLFDELIVLISVDSRKSYTFTSKERMSMTRAAVAALPNVSVDICTDRYVVKQAASVGARVVVRGLRNLKDFEDERTLAEENRHICPDVETVWVPCLPDLMHVSSSMVKAHVGVDPDWESQVVRSVPETVVSELKKKFILEKARRHWAKLMVDLKNPQDSKVILEDLLTRYSEPHRSYHDLAHIVTILDELELVDGVNAAVALGAWFHDAMYDTRAKDNEELSAKLARDSIKQIGLLDSLGEQVSDLVLATKHTDVPLSHAAQILIDVDLMILGRSEKEYAAYEAGIREEYAWVPQSDFCSARLKILQSFLDRTTIYSTELFRDKYEQTARSNLKRSIDRLQK